MKFMPKSCSLVAKLSVILIATLGALCGHSGLAQAPYLLPYTIQAVAGGGVGQVAGTPCAGFASFTSYDTFGDGCPASSSSVVVGTDLHDVVVDQQGNVFFIDNGGNGLVRRIDARSGVITVYAGVPGTQTVCSNTNVAPILPYDKYGDGCQANDGKANVGGGYSAPAKSRGLGIAANGDLYIADYTGNIVQKVTANSGLFNYVAGLLIGTAGKPLTFAGSGKYSGDNVQATQAAVFAPRGVTADAAGNIYIADTSNQIIRKVTAATGLISTIAGTPSTVGFAGEGGVATSSLLSGPEDVEVDSSGNLFIADAGNQRIRVIYAGGTLVAKLISLESNGTIPVVGNIYTIAGGGTGIYAQGGGAILATSIAVLSDRKIALDTRGNILIADNGSDNVVWFLDASTGYMRPIAGTYGISTGGAGCPAKTDAFGDNCPGTTATLNSSSSMGVAADGLGNVYVSDSGDSRLRRISTNQTFPATSLGTTTIQVLLVHFAAGDGPSGAAPFTIAGSPDFTASVGACVANADSTLDCPVTVAFTPAMPGLDTANLVVSSKTNGNAIIGISATGVAPAVAFDPGSTAILSTTLNAPTAIATDISGNSYVADTGSNRILRLSPSGVVTVLAGNGTASYTGDGALATTASLSGPRGVTVTRTGAIYIADTGNNVIRRIDPLTSLISTVAGAASAICSAADDTLGDGCLGTAAKLAKPTGVASDLDGNIFISDSGNNVIRELVPTGYIFLTAGGAVTVCSGGDVVGNGCAANAVTFNNPTALQVDATRTLYVADTGNNEVRKLVAQTGTVTLVAGTGSAGSAGNGGPASGAQLSGPTGIAVDAAGNVYIADTGNAAVRLVTASGNINTAVGTLGASGTGTLPGSAFAVQLANPTGVSSNGAGRLIVLDGGNNRAFTDDRGSVVYNFGRTNLTFSSPTLQIQETETGSAAASLSVGSPLFTATGNSAAFTLAAASTNGCVAGQVLSVGVSCLLSAQFTPSALGSVTGTFTELSSTAVNTPKPFITLTGTGAVLTKTSSLSVITLPATGNPQYLVPFTVQTTVTPTACDPTAPSCFPSGTVTFSVDGSQYSLPAAVTNGKAAISITGLSVGQHSVVAVYSGDLFYASSSAPALVVTITQGSTNTAITLTPATAPQFAQLTLSASVTTKTGFFPTGTVTFYSGATSLGTAPVNSQTGVATLNDVIIAAAGSVPAHYGNFGLIAGTFSITAVYSGDANYSTSTSNAATLTISPVASGFSASILPANPGTAQGSTAQVIATIVPSNTLGGTVTFSCTGMPAFGVCTFLPTTLNFIPTQGQASNQVEVITLWTDVPPGVIPTSASLSPLHLFAARDGGTQLAFILGWPLLLGSAGSAFAFRKKLRGRHFLTALALLGVLVGSSAALTGCSGVDNSTHVTPVGIYAVKVVMTGANGTVVTLPITFTVGAGIPGQL